MISIIIPTLNEEKTIEKTLRALAELSFQHEVIISDGKSKDRTIEIAKSLGVKTIIYQGEKRQTIGGGRNLGASIASGEFLMFLDADVIIPNINDFFKKVLQHFENDPKLVGLIVRQEVIPHLETLADKIFFTLVNYVYFFWNNVVRFGGGGGEFQMIRVEAFRKLNGFNETLPAGEDNDLFHRLARIGKTKIDMSLKILHDGRRAHKIGWPKLLFTWTIDWLSTLFFKKSVSKVWEEIR